VGDLVTDRSWRALLAWQRLTDLYGGAPSMNEQATTLAGDTDEAEVLLEAVDVLGDWITRLPASSEFRPAFLVARREIASCVARRVRPQLVSVD
jgi:hypothetical protein